MKPTDSISEASADYHFRKVILIKHDLKHVLCRLDYLSQSVSAFQHPHVTVIVKGSSVITIYALSKGRLGNKWYEIPKVTLTGPEDDVAETKLNLSEYDYSYIREGICEVFRLDGKTGVKYPAVDLESILYNYGLYIEKEEYVLDDSYHDEELMIIR